NSLFTCLPSREMSISAVAEMRQCPPLSPCLHQIALHIHCKAVCQGVAEPGLSPCRRGRPSAVAGERVGSRTKRESGTGKWQACWTRIEFLHDTLWARRSGTRLPVAPFPVHAT